MALLDAEYVETGKVRFIVHPYYLGNPEYGLVAEAAWCAADQDGFFDFQHAVYENFGASFTQANLGSIAASIGLDQNSFAECLSNRTHRTDLESARQAAMQRGVNATPTFFINDQKVEGNQPYERFQLIINQELALSQ